MYLPAFVAFAVSLAACPLVLALLERWRIHDVPTWRSSHDRPTVRGGGIAVAAAAIVGFAVSSDVRGHLLWGLVIGGIALALVGLVDDLVHGVHPLARLAATIVVVAAALPDALHGMTGSFGWKAVAVLAALGWVVGYVNAFNFMDGINGISVAQTAVGGVALAVAAHHAGARGASVAALVVGAASLAFLPFNFPSARVFLGDVGSYFLGGTLAVLVVVAVRSGVPVEAATFPFLLYVADTSVTLARRAARGDRWWDAHHEHTYQRVVDAGWSHASTTGVVAAVAAVAAALGLVSLTGSVGPRIAADSAAVGAVLAYLALPYLIGPRRLADQAVAA